MAKLLLVVALCLVAPFLASARTYLRADGTTDTYTLISRVFGGTAEEVPDCGHNQKHINQGNDGTLNKQVFFFHAHVNSDNDRCQVFDRQRTEIKTNTGSLNGNHGETVTMSWSFKLDAGFQPSTGFTHIHQLKAVGGNEKQPVITITPRKSNPNYLEIIHIDDKEKTTHLGNTPLAPFLGTWVHVTEEATYWNGGGHYKVAFKRVDNNQQLWSLERSNIDMWRTGANYIRGKWGIYRSLSDKGSLRDETVRYDNFCVDKGGEKCT